MPELRIARCRICNRKLTNARSMSVSMGPTCAKRFGVIFEEALAYARTIGRQLDTGLLQNHVIIAAQDAYRERIRRSRQGIEPAQAEPPVPEDQTVAVWSATRGETEDIRVEFDDANHGRTISESGHTYETTANSCTCPHYVHRIQGSNRIQGSGGGACRHMEAFRQAQNFDPSAVPNTDVSPGHAFSDRVRRIVDQDMHQRALQRFSEVDWAEEEAREGVLQTWRENRAFDGVYMSRDDSAWKELRERARGDLEYRYENVLGGTGNSFGIEIEVEFPPSRSINEVARALYDADIIDNPVVHGYHAGASQTGPGYFRLERDGSLNHGVELISPVLFDTPEAWQKIERATEILKNMGGRTNQNTGGHIHIGIAPLDHRTYSWQRLARIGLAYEKQFFRMGGADADLFARSGQPGIHRRGVYSTGLPSNIVTLRGTATAEAARRSFGARYSMFNTTNVDASYGRKPTVEMRYPNSTLNAKQWQAQIQVANAVVHQAAVIRNDSVQNQFTPGLLQSNQHLRHNDNCSEQMSDDNFRKFLDVLGNEEDRLAATWLYTRGRA